ncbi:MAG: TIGR02996 domain-containing protein [Myxococcota bacterium]|nr:TIGR02996 domain-containing protein [Myxococcota bacterium]
MTLLARLLDEWRATFDDALVGPILALGEHLAKTRPPLRARTQAALEVAWHARLTQGDPSDIDVLLDTPWPKNDRAVRQRLAALAIAPPDPRYPPKLLAVYGSQRAHEIAISNVIKRAPTQQLDVLLEGYRKTAFGGARAALERVKRRPCDLHLLAEAKRAIASPPEQRMETALLANPSDTATRAVIADELQAAGDPRGEFIALQLAVAEGTASDAAKRRAAKLLAANIEAWLRPFPNAVSAACRFERGFPIAVVSTAAGRSLDRAIDSPAWSTVEALTIDGRDADVVRLLSKMPLLRALATCDDVLEQLARRGPFPSLRSLGTPSKWFPADLNAFPHLAVLVGRWSKMRDADFERYQRDAVRLGLHSIGYVRVGDFATALKHRAIGPQQMRMTLSHERDRGWLVFVERDTPRASIAWGGGSQYVANFIENILLELAGARVKEIAICADGRGRTAADHTLRNSKKRFLGCEVHFDGAMLDLATVPHSILKIQ